MGTTVQIAPDRPTLGVPSVDDALDEAWVFDIGQGSLVEAQKGLDEYESPGSELARGALAALSGRYADAFRWLDAAYEAASSEDYESRALIANLSYATAVRACSARPDGSIAILDKEPPAVTTWSARRRESSKALTLSEVAMVTVGVSLAGDRLSSREEYERKLEITLQASGASTSSEGMVLHAARVAIAQNHVRMVLYLRATKYQLEAAMGDGSNALQELDSLLEYASKMEDWPLIGWLHMLKGDIRCGIGHEAEVRKAGYPIVSVFSDETMDRALLEEAGKAYARADECYTQAGATRGALRARSRKAVVNALLAESAGTLGDDSFDALREIRDEAQRQLEGTLSDDAFMLELLLRYRAGQPLRPQISSVAAKAKDAFGSGSNAWPVAWARLCLHAASSRLEASGDLGAFLDASAISRLLFDVAGNAYGSYEVVVARTNALLGIGSNPQALEEVSQALETIHAECVKDPEHLEGWMRYVVLGTKFFDAYGAQMDADKLERAANEFDEALASMTDVVAKKRAALDQAAPPSDAVEKMAREAEGMSLDFFASIPYLYGPFSRYSVAQARAIRKISAEGRRAAKAELDALEAAAMETGDPRSRVYAYGLAMDREKTVQAVQEVTKEGAPPPNNPLESLMGQVEAGLLDADPETRLAKQRISTRRSMVSALVGVKAWDEAAALLARIDAEPSELARALTPTEIISDALNRAAIAGGTGDSDSEQAHYAGAAEAFERQRAGIPSEHDRRALEAQGYALMIYGRWSLALAKGGRWAEAFEKADLLRARQLSEIALQAQQSGPASSNAKRLQAQAERIRAELSVIRHSERPTPKRQAELRTELDRILGEMGATTSAATAEGTASAHIGQIARVLPEGTLVLAHAIVGGGLLGWAITREGLVATHCIEEWEGEPFDSRQWGSHVIRVAESLRGSGPEPSDELTALSKVLVSPFADQIARAKRLVVVPHAQLNLLPFAALRIGERPLGLTHAITMVPAASLLRPDDRAQRSLTGLSPEGILVVGNPADMRHVDLFGEETQLKDLPHARAEAAFVGSAYGSEALLGHKATRRAVDERLNRHLRIIHMATHGTLEPSAPLSSGIALANGEELTAADWLSHDLDADLVLLSACNTGGGSFQGGELMGLARSILLAGARGVIVSLWPVDDAATALLMRRLHQEILNDVAVDEALHRACAWIHDLDKENAAKAMSAARSSTRDLLAEDATPEQSLFQSPRLWAPFMLVRMDTGTPSLRAASDDSAGTSHARNGSPPQITGKADTTEDHTSCSGCGKAIQADWKLCPFCGAATQHTCRGCGRDADPAWALCPFCGHQLQAAVDPPGPPLPSAGSRSETAAAVELEGPLPPAPSLSAAEIDKDLSWELHALCLAAYSEPFSDVFAGIRAAESLDDILAVQNVTVMRNASSAGLDRLVALHTNPALLADFAAALRTIEQHKGTFLEKLDAASHSLESAAQEARGINVSEGGVAQFFGGGEDPGAGNASAGQSAQVGAALGSLLSPNVGAFVGQMIGRVIDQGEVNKRNEQLLERYSEAGGAMLEAADAVFADAWDHIVSNAAAQGVSLMDSVRMHEYEQAWQALKEPLLERWSPETARAEAQLVSDFITEAGAMQDASHVLLRLWLPFCQSSADELRAQAKSSLRRFPQTATPYEDLADLELEVGCFREALAACDEGLRVHPDHPGIVLSRIEAMAALGQSSEANAQARAAETAGNIQAPKHFARGLVRGGNLGSAAGVIRTWGQRTGAPNAIALFIAEDPILAALHREGLVPPLDRQTELQGIVEQYLNADGQKTFFGEPDATRLQNAKQEFLKLWGGEDPERVIYFFDWSVWGNAKNAFIITTRRVQWKCVWEFPVRIDLATTPPDSIHADGQKLAVGGETVDVEDVERAAAVVLALQELARKVQE